MERKEPRIVLFDIETIPNLKQVMKIYPSLGDYPGLTLKASITSVICVGWKEFGKNNPVKIVNAWDYPAWKKDINDDYEVVKAAYDILKDADCVVTHNGKRFDWKYLQTRFVFHKIPPLPRILHVDTREEASRNLFMFNNRLNTLTDFLEKRKKLKHDGWDLWVKVSERNLKAQDIMSKYCQRDVLLLEGLFRRLRPFVKSIPNHNLWGDGDRDVCPNCGSTRRQSNGWRVTKTRKYRRFRCMDCGSTCDTNSKGEAPR